MIGICSIILSILHAGFLDNILSGFLLTGFITAAAILVSTEQITAILGLRVAPLQGEPSTYQKLYNICTTSSSVNVPTLIFGICSIAFLFGMKWFKRFSSRHKFLRWAKYIPEIIICVFLSILLSALLDIQSFGVAVIGNIDTSLNVTPKNPPLSFEAFFALLPDVLTLLMVGYVECQTITRQAKATSFPSGERELFALGL